jgi:diguanylate cyclase (GGDEF)-like protein/PAS domain S-box-containing protein
MWERFKAWTHTKSAQYGLYGALLGLIIPFGGMILEILVHKWPFTLLSFIYTHTNSPVFWFVDLSPIVLGYLASIVGRREDRLAHLTAQLEEQVEERTKEFVRQHNLFEALIQYSPLPLVILNKEQRIESCNPAFEKMFGWSESEIINRVLDKLITTEETYSQALSFTTRSQAGETVLGTGVRKRKDGSFVDVEIYAVPVEVSGEQIGAFAIYIDITERKLAEDALKDSETRYRSLFEDSPISLWEEDFSAVKQFMDKLQEEGVVNLRSYFDRNPEALSKCGLMIKVLDVNEATLKLYKATRKDELMQGLGRILDKDSLSVFKEEIIALFNGATTFEAEISQRTMDDSKILGFLRLSVAPGSEDTWEKILVSVVDITERKALEEKLRETLSHTESLARTDVLTGSLNRRAIMEQARGEWARAERERTYLGLAIVDMDLLKEVNDRHGHLVGDAALRLMSVTLEKACRLYDRVGRWGGDEFMIVMPNIEPTSAQAIAERLLARVNEAELPLADGGNLHLEACIGVTASMPSDGESEDLDELVRKADKALMQAKQEGRNTIRAFIEESSLEIEAEEPHS